MACALNRATSDQVQPGTEVASLPRPTARVYEALLEVHGITKILAGSVDALEARLYWVRTQPKAAKTGEEGKAPPSCHLLALLKALGEDIQGLNSRLAQLLEELDV